VVIFARIATSASAALLIGSAAGAKQPATLTFRDSASEITSAARLIRGYGTVSSTFRTVAHNRAVGGVPNSYHLLDRAIDIMRNPGVTHRQIDAVLRQAGYALIESLDERDHSHFAFAALPFAGTARPAQGAPAPPVKLLPRVAADEHGTLALDLASQSAGSAQGTVTPQ
jgi:hypothetical protein